MKVREINGFKISYREGTCDEAIIEEMLNNDLIFTGVPEYKCKSNDVIIDVGAHIGVFSVLASRKLQTGKVYAIEPSEESFEYLKRNVAINGANNVFVSKLALSGSKGVTRLYHDLKGGNWGHTITKKISDEFEQIETDNLESYMKDNKIDSCDLLKLNCEGAEYQIILSSSIEVLNKIKMIIIFYHTELADGHSVKDLIEHIKECGFSITIRNKRKNGGWLIAGRTNDFTPVGRKLNYVRVRIWKMKKYLACKLHLNKN